LFLLRTENALSYGPQSEVDAFRFCSIFTLSPPSRWRWVFPHFEHRGQETERVFSIPPFFHASTVFFFWLPFGVDPRHRWSPRLKFSTCLLPTSPGAFGGCSSALSVRTTYVALYPFHLMGTFYLVAVLLRESSTKSYQQPDLLVKQCFQGSPVPTPPRETTIG